MDIYDEKKRVLRPQAWTRYTRQQLEVVLLLQEKKNSELTVELSRASAKAYEALARLDVLFERNRNAEPTHGSMEC